MYVTNQIRFLPITEGRLSRGRGQGLKGSPPTVDTLFYWDAFDEDLAWKTQRDISLSRSSLRKLAQVHFTLWIVFREAEGSRNKHTSWRPASPAGPRQGGFYTHPIPISVSLFERILDPCAGSPASLWRKVGLCGILREWIICWVFWTLFQWHD